MDRKVTEDRIKELAPRPYDYDGQNDPDYGSDTLDLHWNVPNKLPKDFREFNISSGYENDDDGVLWWLACRDCFGKDCDHLVFAEGTIETEEDLIVPFRWLETQDDSLLEWEDFICGPVDCDKVDE